MRLTLKHLSKIKHDAIINGNLKRKFVCSGVSTDSRTIKEGDVFISIRGEKFNGHDFIRNAVERGASALIVDALYSEGQGNFLEALNIPVIVVKETILALGELASVYRDQFEIPVVAIAGSNGKTTTKEMIASVLSAKYSVLKSEGNHNNHIGVPLTLFNLNKKYQIAVIELGTNHFGEISYLAKIVKPTHGLITNIAAEHLEFFGDLDGVFKAEGELFDWIEQNHRQGTIFLNKDDSFLSKQKLKTRKVITFGFDASRSIVRGKNLKLDDRGCASFEVKPETRQTFEISLNVPGKHNAKNALAAVVVGLAFRVPISSIQKKLRSFLVPSKRSEMVEINGVRVINDCYNSNPDSVRAALEMLQAVNTSGKKIAVLADMRELGKEAEELHRMIGKEINNDAIDYLLTYGPLSKFTYDAAHIDKKIHYDQKNMLAEYLVELLTPGDLVLVKGSRGMKMEDVIIFLEERLRSIEQNGGFAA